MVVVFLLIIAFWTPGASEPTKLGGAFYATVESCDDAAEKLDTDWAAEVHGGSTSWACLGAMPGPST